MGLKREMGLMAAINVIIGVMIGSGIFISPQAALEKSGSIGACIIVWIVCGVISLLGALCFAELGTVSWIGSHICDGNVHATKKGNDKIEICWTLFYYSRSCRKVELNTLIWWKHFRHQADFGVLSLHSYVPGFMWVFERISFILLLVFNPSRELYNFRWWFSDQQR